MTASSQISQEEKDRRRESWHQANASVRIEGGTISPEFRALQERHINGEITEDEVDAEIARNIAAMAAASKAKSGATED